MSSKGTDGGPAFPRHIHASDGMTLRDYFAAAALPYALGRDYLNDWGKDGKGHFPSAARAAYNIADAMLKARGEG